MTMEKKSAKRNKEIANFFTFFILTARVPRRFKKMFSQKNLSQGRLLCMTKVTKIFKTS